MSVVFERNVMVYTKPACVQANATYKALDKAGVEFKVIDITQNADALDYVICLGYLQAPVVVVEWLMNGHVISKDKHWSGFRPDRIKALTTDVDEIAEFIASLGCSPTDTEQAATQLALNI